MCLAAVVVVVMMAWPGAVRAQPDRRPDGSTLVYRAPGAASAQNPALTGDSRSLFFTLFHAGYNDGGGGIYRLRLRRGRLRPLLDKPDRDTVNLPGSSWNEAVRRLVFASDLEERDEIWTMDINGGSLERVTRHGDAAHYIEPSFSPDGAWIVFEMQPETADRDRIQAAIWKVRRDGSELVRLTDPLPGGWDDRQPNWSPAGDYILFQRHAVGSEDWEICTVKPDGSGLRNVTRSAASDTDASWSPDGGWIVYSSDRGGLPRANIFIVPAGGGVPLQVQRDRRHYGGAPSWSPDGRLIYFESARTGRDESPTDIWRIAVPAR